jgi:hypothetical protein
MWIIKPTPKTIFLNHKILAICVSVKRFFVRHCQNLRIFSYVNGFWQMSQLVKTKRQANFKGFKRFGAFKGLVEQKTFCFDNFTSWIWTFLFLLGPRALARTFE